MKGITLQISIALTIAIVLVNLCIIAETFDLFVSIVIIILSTILGHYLTKHIYK